MAHRLRERVSSSHSLPVLASIRVECASAANGPASFRLPPTASVTADIGHKAALCPISAWQFEACTSFDNSDTGHKGRMPCVYSRHSPILDLTSLNAYIMFMCTYLRPLAWPARSQRLRTEIPGISAAPLCNAFSPQYSARPTRFWHLGKQRTGAQ